MSYLQTYSHHVSKKHDSFLQPDQSEASQMDATIPDGTAKFTRLRLTSISAQAVINSLTERVTALNLSHNKIETLPQFFPLHVLGLNLSYNMLTHLKGVKALGNIIELNLSHNHLTR
jgi:Leucine-rich repeat (LRR) protein